MRDETAVVRSCTVPQCESGRTGHLGTHKRVRWAMMVLTRTRTNASCSLRLLRGRRSTLLTAHSACVRILPCRASQPEHSQLAGMHEVSNKTWICMNSGGHGRDEGVEDRRSRQDWAGRV